jgi:hypothetical protein
MIRTSPPHAPQAPPRTRDARCLLTSAPWRATTIKTVYSPMPDSAMSGHAHLGYADDPDLPPTGHHQGLRWQEFRSGDVMLVAAKIHLWRRPTTAGLSRNVFAHGRTYPPTCRRAGSSRGPLDRAGIGDLRVDADRGTSDGYGWCCQLSVWWRKAKIAAWTRSCRPSLVRMLRTWVLTVCSPIARSLAICRLL